MLRPATTADAAALAHIYNPYVVNTTITFEEVPVTVDDFASRITTVTQTQGLPWLVYETQGAVLGYSYATPWKARSAYRHTVETAIYVEGTAGRRGLGSLLYQALLTALSEAKVHVALGGIALPNDASIALHERLGFEKVGQLREVGFKLGRWVDVGYWEKRL